MSLKRVDHNNQVRISGDVYGRLGRMETEMV